MEDKKGKINRGPSRKPLVAVPQKIGNKREDTTASNVETVARTLPEQCPSFRNNWCASCEYFSFSMIGLMEHAEFAHSIKENEDYILGKMITCIGCSKFKCNNQEPNGFSAFLGHVAECKNKRRNRKVKKQPAKTMEDANTTIGGGNRRRAPKGKVPFRISVSAESSPKRLQQRKSPQLENNILFKKLEAISRFSRTCGTQLSLQQDTHRNENKVSNEAEDDAPATASLEDHPSSVSKLQINENSQKNEETNTNEMEMNSRSINLSSIISLTCGNDLLHKGDSHRKVPKADVSNETSDAAPATDSPIEDANPGQPSSALGNEEMKPTEVDMNSSSNNLSSIMEETLFCSALENLSPASPGDDNETIIQGKSSAGQKESNDVAMNKTEDTYSFFTPLNLKSSDLPPLPSTSTNPTLVNFTETKDEMTTFNTTTKVKGFQGMRIKQKSKKGSPWVCDRCDKSFGFNKAIAHVCGKSKA